MTPGQQTSDKRTERDQLTDLHETSNATAASRGPDLQDLRRDRDLCHTEFRFGCPMLESGRDLRGLKPRGTLKTHSKENNKEISGRMTGRK